jgi:hypothetical protein
LADDKKQFTWTEKRKQIADLAGQGKRFMEIIAMGYSLDMTSKVIKALKNGQKPPEVTEVEGAKDKTPEREKPLVAVTAPKIAPIVFRIDQKQIVLDPLELNAQYRYYIDLAKKDGGITDSFSEVLTLGIQVLWVLHQDIPLTQNMLKAIFYGYK